MSARIVLCGGGTGGHIYPLLAVHAVMPAVEWLFVGGRGIEQEIVARAAIAYQAISGGGLHGVGVAQAIPNLFRLCAGFGQAWKVLRRFRPNAIVATGGFITVPIALAARLQRIPLIVYLPDIEPALSVRMLGWLATKVAATAEQSRAYFAARKFVATGYPIRRELLAAAGATRAEARRQFGIAASATVVLVFGGSRGARSLNQAVSANAESLLQQAELIHVSGTGEWQSVHEARERLPAQLRERYHAFPYLHAEMGAALAAADLVVSRAGASVLGEFPLFGLPAVLVPYPYAWRYQKVNADYLANQGAATILPDERLATELVPLVTRLLGDAAKLRGMGERSRALARPDAAERIARMVMECIA